MKKVVALFLALSMLLTLCACGRKDSLGVGLAEKYTDKSAKAVEAEELIDAIGTVTRSSGTAIDEARNFYNSLSRSEKREVENYAVLVAAMETFESIQYADLKSKTLEDIRKAISAEEFDRASDLIDSARYSLGDDPDLTAVEQELRSAKIASVIATAQSYAESGDYQFAMDYLGAYGPMYPDSTELVNAYNDIRLEYRTSVKTAAIASAEDAAAGYDYVSAIEALQTALYIVPDDAEMSALLNAYQGSYQDSLLQQAEAAFAQDGYSAALSILYEGLDLLPDNPGLLSAIDYYESFAPVYLMDISPVETGSYSLVTNNSITGVDGTNYGRGIAREYDPIGYGAVEAWNTYLTNKEYSTLSFRVVLHRVDFDNNSGFAPTITVYGDNDIVLYRAVVSKYDLDPIEVTVDISNQIYVKVRFWDDEQEYTIAIVDARFEK